MDIEYERDPADPYNNSLGTTRVLFPDPAGEDAEQRFMLIARLPQYESQLPYKKELFPEEIVIKGIVERRYIFRAMRGEELRMHAELPRPTCKPVPESHSGRQVDRLPNL